MKIKELFKHKEKGNQKLINSIKNLKHRVKILNEYLDIKKNNKINYTRKHIRNISMKRIIISIHLNQNINI